MTIKSKTALFTLIATLAFALSLVVYDVWAINQGGTEGSISFMIYEWSYKYPLFTFASGFIPGVLVGHFFWRIRDTEKTKQISDNSRL